MSSWSSSARNVSRLAAGCERSDAAYLRPRLFEVQADALKLAEDFADAHALSAIYVKGFQPTAG